MCKSAQLGVFGGRIRKAHDVRDEHRGASWPESPSRLGWQPGLIQTLRARAITALLVEDPRRSVVRFRGVRRLGLLVRIRVRD